MADDRPPSDSIRLIVRALTSHRWASCSKDHFKALLAILICSLVSVDISALCPIFVHMSVYIQLIDSALTKLDGAYAQNTIRSYHSDASQFVDWCLGAGVTPFPLEEATLIHYLECIRAPPRIHHAAAAHQLH